MAPYQITIAYDGTEFCGFQRQVTDRTVQGELEKALRRLGWDESSILSAGRTDSGVHASGQVVSFNLEWGHSQQKLLDALNDLLPDDISVKDLSLAPEGFHPRYDARARRYRYQLYFNPIKDPLKERFFWRVWPEPDKNMLRSASKLFIGKYDFRAFGRPPNEKSTSVRTISVFRPYGSSYRFRIGPHRTRSDQPFRCEGQYRETIRITRGDSARQGINFRRNNISIKLEYGLWKRHM
jgi:tRNA pseudouridine38-40 synthase